MTDKTKVIFRHWQDEIIAIFPELPGIMNPATCQSYQHIGQHGACYPHHIIANSRPASLLEYLELAKELICIGYELQVIRRNRQAFYFTRRNAID